MILSLFSSCDYSDKLIIIRRWFHFWSRGNWTNEQRSDWCFVHNKL